MPGATKQSDSSLQSASGELRVVMTLMKPEIILVEDASRLKSEALMMTVSMYTMFHKKCNHLFLTITLKFLGRFL